CLFSLLSLATVWGPPDVYSLSLHDALPIFDRNVRHIREGLQRLAEGWHLAGLGPVLMDRAGIKRLDLGKREVTHGTGTVRRAVRSEEHTSELQSRENLVCRRLLEKRIATGV